MRIMKILCVLCKKEIVFKALREDRDKDFYCGDCLKDNEFFIRAENLQTEILDND